MTAVDARDREPMTHRLLNVLTVLSLLLCAAVGIAWARSYSVLDVWHRRLSDRHAVGVASLRGGTILTNVDIAPNSDVTFLRPGYRTYSAWGGSTNTAPARWSFAGFEQRRLAMSHAAGSTLRVPYWALALAAAAAGAAGPARRAVRRRRRAAGVFCRACGYDLRATPGRCPECGTPATQPASEATCPGP